MLYLGAEGVPHAADGVRAARERGLRPAYVTNNASRAAQAVADHLVALGVPATAADVVTSAQAAARLVAEALPAGSAVLVLGTEALADEARARGLRPVRTVDQAGPAGPQAVLQGISPDTSWRDLAEACVALRGGALWVAGNLDATLPTARGQLPGNGAMVAALRTATGRSPVVAGKPEPALHAEAVQRTGARRPLVVGDRLDTDVLGAVRVGAPSLLVLTGVSDLDVALSAPVGSRPAFVAPDLRGLLGPQPPVEVVRGRASCAGASAERRDDVLHVSAGSRRVADPVADGVADGVACLRAACALAWAGVDAGRRVPSVRGLTGRGLLG